MKVQLVKASTSTVLTVFIQDSASATGAGLAGLDQTSSIVGGYVRMGGTGVALAVDENVTTEGTYEAPSAAAKVRIGTPANMRNGVYELHFHNDLFAAGADILTISLGGAANMADLIIEVQLTDVDLNDAVRAGMTALPAAAADAAGGLAISDTGGLDLDAILADTHELQGDDIPGAISGLNNLATGDLDTALTSIGLDHLVSAAVAGADVTDNSIVAKLVSKDATADWDDFVNTTDSLQAIKDHADTIKSETALIVADTNELQTDNVPGLISTAQADLNTITGATGVNLLTATQNSIDAIEADTGELQTDDIPGLISTAQADLNTITGATGVNLLTATQNSIDAIEADTSELQADDIPGTIAALENISAAEVNTEADAALVDIGLDHLLSASVVGGDIADNSIVAKLASESATADWDTYNNTTDSLEALRNRGDASWITGGGGGITDLLNVVPLIPESIDLADTAAWRLGLMLTNALDDLPSAAEITPGTISIDRKASGGATWTAVVTDTACSEIDGLIYYDEVFDTGTGYVAGDSLRITFKAQKVTVSANDYEISGATGRVFYTLMKEDMRGTDSGALAAVCTEARLAELGSTNLPADIDLILADTDELQTDDTPAAIAALNNISTAEVNTQCDTALSDINLDKLLKNAATWATHVVTGSVMDQVADDGTAVYDRTSDSLQALRDRGDAAWITGGGGSLTELLNVVPLVPESIDLADTATWRLGLMLINTLDDLPTTVEITPGTISIDRKASGGTTWSAVVTNSACSEAAGLVYYDEVFDTGTGYVVGDSIRITFKSQKITVAANDYEVSDATGRIFYTQIREDMRGTDSGALAAVCTATRLAELDAANLPADIDALAATLVLIAGSGFDTSTDSLKQIRDAIDVLVAPAVVGSSALSGYGFLSDVVSLIRQATDEPSASAKYTDSSLVELIQVALDTVLTDIHINTDHPIIVRYNITLVDGTQDYILPPNVGELLRVAKINSTTGLPEYEVWPGSYQNPGGCGWKLEGNVLRLLRDWDSTDTLELTYMPNAEPLLHYGTPTAVAASTITLAATPTDGTLGMRPNEYVGMLVRILSSTTKVQEERLITAYNVTTRVATINKVWDTTPVGTMTYEVVPIYSRMIKHLVALRASIDLLSQEGNSQRMATLNQNYLIKMSALRRQISKKEGRFPHHFDGDTWDNENRGSY